MAGQVIFEYIIIVTLILLVMLLSTQTFLDATRATMVQARDAGVALINQ